MERISKIQFEGGRIYMAADTGKIYSRPLEAFPASDGRKLMKIYIYRIFTKPRNRNQTTR